MQRSHGQVRLAGALAIGLATVALGGCTPGDGDGTGSTSALPAAFDDGVPEPVGEVLLTLEGPDGAVDWDEAALAALPQHEMTILEPFVQEQMTFTGPAFADVLLASGLDPDAEVELTALDDYQTTLPTDPSVLDGVLLATAADGAPIELADGGPIRIVFPDDHSLAENSNHWIWSLRSGAQQ